MGFERPRLSRPGLRRPGLVRPSMAEVLQVVRNGRLHPSASFSRPDEAAYFNASGILETAAENEARTTYIDGVPLLLMEGERTNRVPNASDATSLTGTGGASASDPSETLSAGTITFNKATISSNGGAWNVAHTVTSISASDGDTFSITVFLQAGTSGNARVTYRDQTNSLESHVSGTIGSLATTSTSAGAISNLKEETITIDGEDVTKVSFTVTHSSGASSDVRVGSGPFSTTNGETVITVGSQVESGAMPSSFIDTSGGAASRDKDDASLANSIISSLTKGVIYAEVYSEYLASDAARHIAELKSDANNFIRVQHSADGDLDAHITSGGTSRASLFGTDLTVGTLHKVALTFGSGGPKLFRDGSPLAFSNDDTYPSVDTLLIGAGLFGGIKTLNVEVNERTQASAEALTA